MGLELSRPFLPPQTFPVLAVERLATNLLQTFPVRLLIRDTQYQRVMPRSMSIDSGEAVPKTHCMMTAPAGNGFWKTPNLCNPGRIPFVG